MTINRYRANSLKAAIDKARADLGPEAKVLHVKQLSGDSKLSEKIEIIAAVDDETAYETQALESPRTRGSGADAPEQGNEVPASTGAPLQHPSKPASSIDLIVGDEKRTLVEPEQEVSGTSAPGEDQAPYHVNRRRNAHTGASYITSQALESPRTRGSEASVPKVESGSKPAPARASDRVAATRRVAPTKGRISQMLHECLVRNQVDTEITYEILSMLNDDSDISLPESKDPEMRDYLSAFMERRISMSGGLDESKKVVILIGPTGVGKTTTLAKLAARHHFYREKAVGLITIDAYRISAIEQLKTYAQIMAIPLKVALTPEELEGCIDDYRDMDLVLIDTPGRSQLNIPEIRAIEEFLEAAQPADTHLLISASMKEKDAHFAVENFAPEYVQQFIFTKLDETTSFGSILNLCVKAKKPVSYLTTGQNVPDDIRQADVGYLLDLFVTKSRANRL